MKDGLLLKYLKGDRQEITKHTLIRRVIFTVGGKYTQSGCMLDWIRRLRERQHKQTAICKTGMQNTASCYDLAFYPVRQI